MPPVKYSEFIQPTLDEIDRQISKLQTARQTKTSPDDQAQLDKTIRYLRRIRVAAEDGCPTLAESLPL